MAGANLYAPSGQASFVTKDFDFLIPPDPDNLVEAWAAGRQKDQFFLATHIDALEQLLKKPDGD